MSHIVRGKPSIHHAPAAHHQRHLPSFWRHFLEMLAVMAVGMIATGAIFVSVVGLKTWDQVTVQYPTQALLAMAAGMTIPMVAWMLSFGGLYNYGSWWVAQRAWGWFSYRSFNRWRADLGLRRLPPLAYPYTRLHHQPVPTLYAFSELVVEKPSDWGDHIHLTGYWPRHTPADWKPPANLARFLDAGAPPLYGGFGSMPIHDGAQLLDVVLEAIETTHHRAILASGWAGLRSAALPDSVLMVDYVPHEWLFSQVAAVVHHGGAGTTAASLRAGVPTIAVPFAGDQPFWARRIEALGVGPPAIPRRRLNAAKLARAIHTAITDQAMRANAIRLASALVREDAGSLPAGCRPVHT